MVSYPKVESDNYLYTANTYVKPRGSKVFVDLRNNYSLISESVAKIYINKRKYDYEWYDVELNSGDIIKHEITRTYKTKDGLRNKKETHYYLAKRNKNHVDENPFPTITGDIFELSGNYKKSGDMENVNRNKNNQFSR